MMLRFVILSTLAGFVGSLVVFVITLGLATLLYAVAAAGTVPLHQRLAMFGGE